MVGASKILTVSYGTFSCTLEGFEDSFGTMKAIAEYFRDLAAHDRYFGAEPPTPDADMLARIAEREISRRVEARSDESGITLRASDALAAPTPEPAAAPAPEQAVKPAGPDADKSRAEKTAEHDAKSALVEPEAHDIDTQHVETPEAAAPQIDATEAETPQPAAPEAAPSVPATPLEADWDDTAEEDLGDLVEDEIDSETFEDAPEPEAPAEPVQAEAAPVQTAAPAHPDPDSVAAKLQRIRAVVGRAEDAGDYSEDLTEAPAPETPQEVATTLAGLADPQTDDITAAPAEDHAQDSSDDQSGEDDGDDDILSSILARSGEVGDTAEIAADEVSETAADPQDTAEDFEVSLAQALASDAETSDAAETDADETEVAPAEAEPQAAPRARVTRMKRAEFEAAMATGAIEPVEADAPDETTPPEEMADLAALDGAEEFDEFDDDIDSGLSAEEEAALLEELAAVDETGDDEDDDEPLSAIGAEYEDDDLDDDQRPSRAELLRTRPEEDEQAMSRLMSEADNQMQEPEGNRRREAIAHLKAAVAATEAARRMGETPGDAAEGEVAYRDDLDRVVRPRRTARPTEARTERPRPAPLKLVAAQRVDASDGAETPEAPAPARPVTPVRPRRVTAEPEAPARPATAAAGAPAEAASGFAEFCAKMGAYDLADQLEAAAAYTAYVEGVEDFSRPQIMRKVRDMSPDEFSREDGLRSFGTLLRDGRIQKVRNGRFQVAEDTRFHPARRTG